MEIAKYSGLEEGGIRGFDKRSAGEIPLEFRR
jgi:hypothetical protein